jgi:nucleoside 2-deoxyribosyltransferase
MKLFMSYGGKDALYAASLAESLKGLGVLVFADKYIAPGESWEHILRKEIEESDAAVLVVPESGSSRANNAFFEAGAARALGKPVFAVMPDAIGRETPVNIADWAIFDAAKKSFDDVAKSLVNALEAV